MAYCCPCVVFGQNADKVEEGSCVKCGVAYCCLGCLAGAMMRPKIQEKVGAEQTQIRIQYRTARNGKWKDKHASVSAPAVCYNGSTYTIALR